MCGIAGVLHDDGKVEHNLGLMIGRLRHRGPDDVGLWLDVEGRVGLAHARLSVLELSNAGHQPMHSRNGRFVVVFNGEIYNHLELRRELTLGAPKVPFRGHSDTETLLAGFEEWGIEGTLLRCVGMFAFGVWDRVERSLILARDRLGEKPLYYGLMGSRFVFASELAAIRAHPAFNAAVDPSAVDALLRFGYVAGRSTVFENIWRLPPGTTLVVSAGQGPRAPQEYWDCEKVIRSAAETPFVGSARDSVQELGRRLETAVRGQMLADVPVGAFLSGGIDSSTVVALMQQSVLRPVKTFAIGFQEQSFNEADHAAAVAKHLGTDHTELYVDHRQLVEVIPQLPSMFSEPFADPSQIPTFLVSALARSQVTVSLSGDGGDELFGGYEHYATAPRRWRRADVLPKALRRAAHRVVLALASSADDWPEGIVGRFAPIARYRQMRVSFDRLGDLLGADTFEDYYRHHIAHVSTSEKLVKGDHVASHASDAIVQELDSLELRMMAIDLQTYLPDDILVKLDRAAMHVSLETRAPFLDHRVVEFACSLPLAVRRHAGVPKWPLKELLYRYVPRHLVDRPKMGFGVPLASWLRGPLRDWGESLISEAQLEQSGILQTEPIRRMWLAFQSGCGPWRSVLWNILVFQAWRQEND